MGTIYDWFNQVLSLYSGNLAEHMWGWDGSDYTRPIVYNIVAIWLFVTSILIPIIYYYVINHPKFCRWYHWGIMLLANFLVNLSIGYSYPYSDLMNDGIVEDLTVYSSDCFGFGLINGICSVILFTLVSFIIKWKSTNCKYSPL